MSLFTVAIAEAGSIDTELERTETSTAAAPPMPGTQEEEAEKHEEDWDPDQEQAYNGPEEGVSKRTGYGRPFEAAAAAVGSNVKQIGEAAGQGVASAIHKEYEAAVGAEMEAKGKVKHNKNEYREGKSGEAEEIADGTVPPDTRAAPSAAVATVEDTVTEVQRSREADERALYSTTLYLQALLRC